MVVHELVVLEAHAPLRARAGSPADWRKALATTGAALFRHDDPDGTLVLVVVGRDDTALAAATAAMARLSTMVQPGWTALPI